MSILVPALALITAGWNYTQTRSAYSTEEGTLCIAAHTVMWRNDIK